VLPYETAQISDCGATEGATIAKLFVCDERNSKTAERN
jgi:hypothetical protein